MQVFIHDPLYKWALSPLKAMQRQKVYCSIHAKKICLVETIRDSGSKCV